MQHPQTRRAVILRTAGFVCAVALGGVGVWLIVVGNTDKTIRLGVLAGLWGLLLGTFAMFGSRRGSHALGADEDNALAIRRAELEAEQRTSLARVEDAAAQRAYEARLEHMLRHEIQATMAREVANLRAEIASLRTDLLDKVGGQIKLERIETTRLIGSDLEALQREVRQLRDRALVSALEPEPVVEPMPRPSVRPIPRHDYVDVTVVEPADDYRGRRRRDDEDAAGDAPRRAGRDSPEGAELLARLLSRERSSS